MRAEALPGAWGVVVRGLSSSLPSQGPLPYPTFFLDLSLSFAFLAKLLFFLHQATRDPLVRILTLLGLLYFTWDSPCLREPEGPPEVGKPVVLGSEPGCFGEPYPLEAILS